MRHSVTAGSPFPVCSENSLKEKGDVSEIPKLPSFRHPNGVQSLVWCAHCGDYHWHTVPEGEQAALCNGRSNGHYEKGYILVEHGPAPPPMVNDAHRERPRGQVRRDRPSG
jgi:hypothetical protein